MRTRAAVAERRGEPLRVAEVELRSPGPGEVRVRMQACGICRSDLHAIDGGEDVRYPAVLGHEGAGVVEAVGEGVREPAQGDFVVLSWTPACGRCSYCREGRVHLCRELTMSSREESPMRLDGRPLDRFMGLGLFSERVVVRASMAVPVDTALPAEESCLVGCAVMTGFGAAVHTAAVRWGESVAVLGCGGVGLAAIQGARLAGAGEIVAIDPLEARRRAALDVGATRVLAAEGALKRLFETLGDGVDVAIECVGRTEVMREALKMTRPGGRCVVVGLPDLDAVLELPAILLLGERRLTGSLYGSANPAVDFQRLLDLCAGERLDLSPLVGRTRPLHEVNEGIEDTRSGRYTRVVLTF